MVQSIEHAWRVVATGIAFGSFGIGGLVLGLVVLPLVRLLPGTPRERDFRCQRVVHHTFRIFVAQMQAMGLMTVRFRDPEELRRPGQLVVANHPTLLDAVFLVSQMPQADCVIKRAILSNAFMRGVVRCAGYLSNDLGDELIEACAERLRDGRSLLLFPEGTRSPAGRLGEFQRGAAHVALRSGKPLRPVTIHCDPPGLVRGQKWYDVADRPLEIDIECDEPIYPVDLPAGPRGRGAAARRLTSELRDFYEKRLQNQRSQGS